jgi:4'-phosphopantetheinyl transferase
MDVLPFRAVHVDLVETANAAALDKLDSYRPLLSQDEHERMARLVFDRDRRAFLITRALVRTMLSPLCGGHAHGLALHRERARRPEIVGRPSGTPDLRFNISHTDGLIACAVTIGREVGVDVEHIGRRLTHDVPGRFFAPDEVTDLRTLPGGGSTEGLLRLLDVEGGVHQGARLRAGAAAGDFAFKLNPPGPPAIRFEPSLETIPRRGNSCRTGRRRSIAWASPCAVTE